MLFIWPCLSIGTIIGTCTCTGNGTGIYTCPLPEWDNDVLDSLKNVVLIHDIIWNLGSCMCWMEDFKPTSEVFEIDHSCLWRWVAEEFYT